MKVNEDTGLISGTLFYVAGYTGFSSKAEEQSGNYIALDITPKSGFPESLTVEVKGGTSGPSKLTQLDHQVVLKIKDTSKQSILIKATNKGVTETKEYALTGVTLKKKQLMILKPYNEIDFPGDYARYLQTSDVVKKGKKFSDVETADKYMSVDNCQVQGNNIYIESVRCNKDGWFDNKPVVLLCYDGAMYTHTQFEMNGIKWFIGDKKYDNTYLKHCHSVSNGMAILFIEIEEKPINEMNVMFMPINAWDETQDDYYVMIEAYADEKGISISDMVDKVIQALGLNSSDELLPSDIVDYYGIAEVPDELRDIRKPMKYMVHVNTFD